MAKKRTSVPSGGVATKKMRITRRIVNSKRHTIGYVVGGQEQTIDNAAALARRGMISGVRVVGNHIQAEIGRHPLASLPTTIRRSRKVQQARRKG